MFLLLASPLAAQTQREAGLELVLLADASGSIDAEELAFQRQGYALAITDEAVVAAIPRRISVTPPAIQTFTPAGNAIMPAPAKDELRHPYQTPLGW